MRERYGTSPPTQLRGGELDLALRRAHARGLVPVAQERRRAVAPTLVAAAAAKGVVRLGLEELLGEALGAGLHQRARDVLVTESVAEELVDVLPDALGWRYSLHRSAWASSFVW